ncbi:hypothetical protein vseg_013765 [Gypsophila vaccaria]
MELPQSLPFGTTPARKATHDFLSLYSHSTLSQDPRPSHGDLPKTQNFLQPLEGERKNNAKENSAVDKNVKPTSTSAVEHVLPGGIGTYSISCLPYVTQKVPKSEENGLPVVSVASSEAGANFMLWHESTMKKGDTGKESLVGVTLGKEPTNVGQWPLGRPSQSSSNRHSSVSPFSSSQILAQKNHSFMEMLKSTKRPHSVEDDDAGDLCIKKESNSYQKGEFRVEVDGKNTDQKATTPRSKHSATEQRRRCKINDRFQMLREIIPHIDQKKDKASFLLEVIEYIQYLQEKVNCYEAPHPGLSNETSKLIPRSNNHGPSESFVAQPGVANSVTDPVLMLNAKPDENTSAVSLNIPMNAQTKAECTMNGSMNFKTVDSQSGLVRNGIPTSLPIQADVYASFRNGCAVAQPPARIPCESKASLPQMQLWPSRPSEAEPFGVGVKVKTQELAVEGGTINISSKYSQGLLNTLTRALQNSGVDLSQASISVQVDIGKRANKRQSTPDSLLTSAEAPCNDQSLQRGRVGSISNESDHMVKKLKTS